MESKDTIPSTLPPLYREMLSRMEGGVSSMARAAVLCGEEESTLQRWYEAGEMLALPWDGWLMVPGLGLLGTHGSMRPVAGMLPVLEEFEAAGVDEWGALAFLLENGVVRPQEIPPLLPEMSNWLGHGRPAEEGDVDVVDAHDRVIGCLGRQAVHARGLRHRFVQVVVEGSDSRFLLQRRSMRKEKGPGLFDASVGGHVDAGENYEEAARREAAEELGLDPLGTYIDMGTIVDHSPGVENMVGRLYLHASDGPFTGWEEEADRIEWVSPAELAFMTERFPYLFTGGMLSTASVLLGRR